MGKQKEMEDVQPESLVSAWIKSSCEFWQTLAGNLGKQWETGEDKGQGRAQKTMPGSFPAFFEMSRSLNTALLESGVLDSAFTDAGKYPELTMRFSQLFFNGLSKQFQTFMTGFQDGAASSAEKQDGDLFESFRQTYAQGMQKMFDLPQLGLTRAYQERMNEALHRFNQFAITTVQFFALLNRPVERSLVELQNTVAAMSKGEGEYSEDPEEYYKLWIKYMEGEYMQLFKTEEFVDAFHQMVNHYIEFQGVQDKVLGDLLKAFPVSTKEELDEVAKENYLLKKEVKKLARRVEELEKSSSLVNDVQPS